MPIFPDIQETQERNGIVVSGKKDQSRPGFEEIYEAHLERRRLELLRASAQRREADKKQQAPDYSMQKFYLSLLLRLGGLAPVVAVGNPDASAILLRALQAWRCGARRQFSQDTDLYSMPQFPAVRLKKV